MDSWSSISLSGLDIKVVDQSKVPLENETIGVQVKSSAFLNPKKKEEKKRKRSAWFGNFKSWTQQWIVIKHKIKIIIWPFRLT